MRCLFKRIGSKNIIHFDQKLTTFLQFDIYSFDLTLHSICFVFFSQFLPFFNYRQYRLSKREVFCQFPDKASGDSCEKRKMNLTWEFWNIFVKSEKLWLKWQLWINWLRLLSLSDSIKVLLLVWIKICRKYILLPVLRRKKDYE